MALKNYMRAAVRKMAARNLERYTGIFKPVSEIVQQSFMRKAKRIEHVDPAQVMSVAVLLEAQCVMAEEMEPTQMLTLSVRNDELCAFVSYMRSLDTEYRRLAASAQKTNRPVGER